MLGDTSHPQGTPSRSFLVKPAIEIERNPVSSSSTGHFPYLCNGNTQDSFVCCGSVLGLSRLRSILREERVPRGRQCVSQERTRSAKKAFRTVTADNTWFSSHCLRLLLVFVCLFVVF